MNRGAGQELHVEMAHVHPPSACFTHQCKRLDEQTVEWLAAASPIAQRQTGLFKVEIGQSFQVLFERSDLRNVACPLLQRRTGDAADD